MKHFKMSFFLLFLSAIFFSSLSQAEVKNYSVLIKNKQRASEYITQLQKNRWDFKDHGELSFGRLLTVSTNQSLNQTLNQFFYSDDSKMISSDSEIIVEESNEYSIGPRSLSATSVFLPSKNLASWQWGFHNTGTNTPEQEGRPKPLSGLPHYDARVTEAWKLLKPVKKEIVVAVVDSGLDLQHREFVNTVWINQKELKGSPGVDDDGNGYVDDVYGINARDNSNNVNDEHGHGTHCSGIIAAEGTHEDGIRGLAPGVKVMPIKVFDSQGSTTSEILAKGIEYAIQMHADVISASWGGPSNQLIEAAIRRAREKGILFVAAAGNDGIDIGQYPFFPSGYDVDNIISVAAHQNAGDLAFFSNYGKQKVHLSAPGQYILSTIPGNKYAVLSGTSMATPFVSAAVALLLQQKPGMNYLEAKKRLLQSTLPQLNWRKKIVSLGRLNVSGLLKGEIIDRGIPKEKDWLVYKDQPPFETSHPVGVSHFVKDFRVPGAKFVRFVFSKINFTKGMSDLHIRESLTKNEVETTPHFVDTYFRTDFVEGENIGFRFSSSQANDWGFRLEAIEYQK